VLIDLEGVHKRLEELQCTIQIKVTWYTLLQLLLDWPNPSGHAVALGSTQPLTEMSTRNLPGGKGQPACKTDNLTAVCEPIV
jgi:hypothetical protein